ncbi:MAG TPA: LacI family DNA-binding transcriptional regulator, partial [Rhodothermales bacterium]|nr:LacI family DNA-binding transcriptional regulator [Rhodothermales bacterium]
MTVTLSDIAQKAGVSISTVSRVLNKKAGKYRISEETEKLILRTARELSYRPNQLARGLRLKRTNTLGLIAPDVSNPFFAYIIRRAQNVAHGYGYSVVVCNTDENLDLEVEHVNLLHRQRVDGLIAMPVGVAYEHFEEWRQRGTPLVLVDRCLPAIDASTVIVDNYAGSFDAIKHLIEHGHERIAFIQGIPGTHTNNERLRGYREALEAHGVPADEKLIVGSDFRQENGYIETKLLLNMDEPPTAIFATSDLISLGAMQAIYEEGLEIPRDISMVMFDDFDFAPFLKCPLSAVRQPKEMMGEMAVKI